MNADWYSYELHVCAEHLRNFGGLVWHGSVIPEDELEKAGFIDDFSRHRLLRISRKRQKKGLGFQYKDYGMDFLQIDENGVYHAGQAKYYAKSRYVTSRDICTFKDVVLLRLRTPGYLYTVKNNLYVELREDFQRSRGLLVHIVEPFDACEDTSSSTSFSSSAKCREECDIDLRPYQQEAIDQLLQIDRAFLQLFCGGGKTIITGHVLKKKNPKRIIAIAPLRVSVDQLRKRLSPFLPNHKVLLVDSDSDGTTDVKLIEEFLKQHKKVLVCSTFKSTTDVLAQFAWPSSAFFVVDEFHNMIGNSDLVEFANEFKKSLFLSATVPEEAHEQLKVDGVVSIPFSEGIKQGYICDYNVYLPYIDDSTGRVDVEIPEDLFAQEGLKDDRELAEKAMFLATGMLKTGSRRCIVYLANQQECDDFLQVARIAFEEYHALQFWGKKIDATVDASKRSLILQKFNSYDDNIDLFRLIASVRILDEAIDIPKCDSTFLTVIGEATSDIRSVQRMSRACRLDPTMPNKKNSTFMWCDDLSKAVRCLSILKESDPEFHKKVRCLDASYDSSGKLDRKTQIAERKEVISNFIRVKCLTLDELWELRRQQWIEQYTKKGNKKPSEKAKDPNEKRSARWQMSMRGTYKGMKTTSRLTSQMISILDSTPGWTWLDDCFQSNLDKWISVYKNKGNQKPSQSAEKGSDERKASQWEVDIQRTYRGYRKNRLTTDMIDTLDSTPGWKWQKPKNAFQLQLENWSSEYERNGNKKPSRSAEKGTNEKKAASWMSDIRQAYKAYVKGEKTRRCAISSIMIDKLNKTKGWTWEG